MNLLISVSKQIRISDLGLRVQKGEITCQVTEISFPYSRLDRLNFQAISPSVIIIMSKPRYISLFGLPPFLPPKKKNLHTKYKVTLHENRQAGYMSRR